MNKLSVTISEGEYTTEDYSSKEMTLLIDGVSIKEMILNASKSMNVKICQRESPMLNSCIPYLDIAEYQNLNTNSAKRILYCSRSYSNDCKYDCWFNVIISQNGPDVIWSRFIRKVYNRKENKTTAVELELQPFVFNKNAYLSLFERIMRSLISKEQTKELRLPTDKLMVFHNDKITPFFVRGASNRTCVYPDNDENLAYEASADACLEILIPIDNTKPGDIIHVKFDHIIWSYDSDDEDIRVYGGYHDHFYYGLCVPAYDTYDYDGAKLDIPFETCPLTMNDYLHDHFSFNELLLRITSCGESMRQDYIIMTIAWCSDQKKYSGEIATGVTW